MPVSEWAAEDRPRERFLKNGAGALSTAELLAILIRTGCEDESVVSLTRRLLADNGNSLTRLANLSVQQLCEYKGIGETKAVTILAALEIARRKNAEKLTERKDIRSSKDLYAYFYPIMADLCFEKCYVLFISQSGKALDCVCISQGGISSTIVDVRIIVREAVLRHAVAIAICHNHPSGNPQPSSADDSLTQKIKSACRMMDIQLLDHLIFAADKYYSYTDNGRL